MMIADLHIHSRFSRATSQDMTIPRIAEYARLKGIGMVGSGDFTHPGWLAELRQYLKPKDGYYEYNGVRFILTAEVNNIYTRHGRSRRMHNLIFTPDIASAERINRHLARYGKLESDGRPILTLDTLDMLKALIDLDPANYLVPAHIWTPWFSLFGSNSGFDDIAECFADYQDRIFAAETGLSSDPAMNWRLSALDRCVLLSNSDAHSPNRLGREANVFREPLNYHELRQVLMEKDRARFKYTIEFYPEEGKYHYDGHRKCQVRMAPKEARLNNNLCPVCSRNLTLGVLHRVEMLADRDEGFRPDGAIPYRNLIPLEEIIAEALRVGRDSVAVRNEYRKLCREFGNEFAILLDTPIDSIKTCTDERVALGVDRARRGEVSIDPGYDGEFGTVKLFGAAESTGDSQLGLF